MKLSTRRKNVDSVLIPTDFVGTQWGKDSPFN